MGGLAHRRLSHFRESMQARNARRNAVQQPCLAVRPRGSNSLFRPFRLPRVALMSAVHRRVL